MDRRNDLVIEVTVPGGGRLTYSAPADIVLGRVDSVQRENAISSSNVDLKVKTHIRDTVIGELEYFAAQLRDGFQAGDVPESTE